MRLMYDHSPGAYAVRVQCYVCGKLVQISNTVIDVEGPPFQAYYCPDCRPEGEPVEPCNRTGCTTCQP